jgi:hypothetical protein
MVGVRGLIDSKAGNDISPNEKSFEAETHIKYVLEAFRGRRP